MDYYKVLGVEKTATQDDIRSAYRKLAMQYHPDRNPGDKQAEEKFKEVQTAYDVLGDLPKKANYDRKKPGVSSFVWDFAFNNVANPSKVQERGRNIQINVELEINDVLTGITKNISIPKRSKCDTCEGQGFTEYKPCPSCHGSGKIPRANHPPLVFSSDCNKCRGTGRAGSISCTSCQGHGFISTGSTEVTVNIPPGVDTGHQLRLADYGEPSKNPNGKNGDLHIIILIKEHKTFKRHGVNITCEFPVGFTELCLGTTIEVPTLTGSTVINIPPRTEDYTQFRLKGMGLPYVHGGKGDLIVVVKLILPDKDLVESNKELFEKITQLEKVYLDRRGK